MGTGELLGLAALVLAFSKSNAPSEPVNTSKDFWAEAPPPQGSPSAMVKEWADFVLRTTGKIVGAIDKNKGW